MTMSSSFKAAILPQPRKGGKGKMTTDLSRSSPMTSYSCNLLRLFKLPENGVVKNKEEEHIN